MAIACFDIDAARLSPTAPGGPYRARSASDRTEDWPLWYVCAPDGRTNVLSFAAPYYGAVLTGRAAAETIATHFNDGGPA